MPRFRSHPADAEPEADRGGRDIDVLVVDDHPMTRAGIVRALNVAGRGIRVVGEAGSAEQAVTVWRDLRPTVTLMDLQMPDGDGIEAIERIRAEEPAASIVALTAFTNGRARRRSHASGGERLRGQGHHGRRARAHHPRGVPG